ncbi:MAG: Rrf2 family transcriptional regulator [Clostridiales bacterium]|nr:Rrf2 family transcriptional regulator [Aminicella lysinilytica]NLD11613.1 Rrf2 family transcriptional regulator [Clostridiales bacterium]
MKISTKGRYALRVLIDLAEHNSGEFVPLKEIAARQDISEKYLESIIVVFSKAGLLIGHRGKGGGYKLAKPAENYKVGDVLRLIEGDLAPVTCLDGTHNTCPRAAACKTLPMWQKFYAMTNEFFDSYTVADLADRGSAGDDYSI